MKVLITHELFPPTVHGGGEKIVYEMARNLKKEGVKVEVLACGNPKIREFDNIPTHRLPIHRYLMNLAVPSVYAHAKNFDIIQTCNYNACFASFVAGKILLKKPTVCFVIEVYNEKWFELRGMIGGELSRIVERLQVRHRFDKFIFLSDYMKEIGIRIGIPPEKIEVINPGIYFHKFKMKKKEPFVLFVGNLTRRKGLDYLIRAAKELPKIKFVIVGKGKEYRRLKPISPKNVYFIGPRYGKELRDIYAKAQVFCLPSIGEGFGLVLLEAMASGCAIVSTIPLDYSGFRVEVGNVGQLKEKIEWLIENPEEAKKLGKKNRKKAKKYTWKRFIKKLLRVYEEVLS
jgi:glycosyltransferase involved in cell wall biosynthesis